MNFRSNVLRKYIPCFLVAQPRCEVIWNARSSSLPQSAACGATTRIFGGAHKASFNGHCLVKWVTCMIQNGINSNDISLQWAIKASLSSYKQIIEKLMHSRGRFSTFLDCFHGKVMYVNTVSIILSTYYS